VFAADFLEAYPHLTHEAIQMYWPTSVKIAVGATDVDGAFLSELAENSVDGLGIGVFAIDEKGNVHHTARERTLG
jgi:hypothetical protein